MEESKAPIPARLYRLPPLERRFHVFLFATMACVLSAMIVPLIPGGSHAALSAGVAGALAVLTGAPLLVPMVVRVLGAAPWLGMGEQILLSLGSSSIAWTRLRGGERIVLSRVYGARAAKIGARSQVLLTRGLAGATDILSVPDQETADEVIAALRGASSSMGAFRFQVRAGASTLARRSVAILVLAALLVAIKVVDQGYTLYLLAAPLVLMLIIALVISYLSLVTEVRRYHYLQIDDLGVQLGHDRKIFYDAGCAARIEGDALLIALGPDLEGEASIAWRVSSASGILEAEELELIQDTIHDGIRKAEAGGPS